MLLSNCNIGDEHRGLSPVSEAGFRHRLALVTPTVINILVFVFIIGLFGSYFRRATSQLSAYRSQVTLCSSLAAGGTVFLILTTLSPSRKTFVTNTGEVRYVINQSRRPKLIVVQVLVIVACIQTHL